MQTFLVVFILVYFSSFNGELGAVQRKCYAMFILETAWVFGKKKKTHKKPPVLIPITFLRTDWWAISSKSLLLGRNFLNTLNPPQLSNALSSLGKLWSYSNFSWFKIILGTTNYKLHVQGESLQCLKCLKKVLPRSSLHYCCGHLQPFLFLLDSISS